MTSVSSNQDSIYLDANEHIASRPTKVIVTSASHELLVYFKRMTFCTLSLTIIWSQANTTMFFLHARTGLTTNKWPCDHSVVLLIIMEFIAGYPDVRNR